MKKTLLSLSLIILHAPAFAQDEAVQLKTESGTIHGSLLVPQLAMIEPAPVVLIIAGSGPTDRNGNQPMMQNNSLKLLAEALYEYGIASLRYDKRGIAASQAAGGRESDLRFQHYIDDAADWIQILKEDSRFNSVVVAGHSEGSMIGMAAVKQAGADLFISITGPGNSLDNVIRKQLQNQPPFVRDAAFPILDQLSAGEQVSDVPPMLVSLFRESVQPYLISIFQFDPAAEIAKLQIPVMIIHGTADLQIDNEETELLKNAAPQGVYLEIADMNHVLKTIDGDLQQNMQSYNNPNLPLADGLIEGITEFIRKNSP